MPGALRVIDFVGRYHTEPSTRSQFRAVGARRVNLDNPFTPTILARFNAGESDVVHEHRDLGDFLTTHDPEKTTDAASRVAQFVFKPGLSVEGPPAGPGLVRTIRVGDGAQAPTKGTGTLDDITPETVATISSIDAGAAVNLLRFKVATPAAGAGRDLLVGYRDNPGWVKHGKNLGPLWTLDYTGNAASATVVVTKVGDASTRLQITLVGAADGSVSLDLDLTSADFDTCQKVADYINRQIAYEAVPATSDVALSDIPSSEIDSPGALELVAAGPTLIEAKIGAMIAWAAVNCTRIGPVAGVVLARVATKTNYPEPMAAYVNLAGGSQPATIAADWSAALEVLVRDEIPHGCIVLDTSDATVQALVSAWIDDQLVNSGRIWRAVFGLPAATTTINARIYAGNTDNTRIGVVHQRLTDIADPTLTLDPMYGAAAIAGATGGINFERSAQSAVLTKRRFGFGGVYVSDKQDKTVREASLDAGVMTWMEQRGGRVLLSLNRSTYAERGDADDRFRMLWSESCVLDAIAISIEERLEPLQVAWATQEYVASVRDEVTQVLRAWEQRGFISAGIDPATGESKPAFTPPVVTVLEGRTDISVELGMVGETDHLRIAATIRRLALNSEG